MIQLSVSFFILCAWQRMIVTTEAFVVTPFDTNYKSATRSTDAFMFMQRNAMSRRDAVHLLGTVAPFWLLLKQTQPVQAANDEIFKTNPLTNGILEQIRIWDQASADQLKYGGELAPGDAGNKGKVEQYPTLLIPILEIAADVTAVATTLVPDPSRWAQAQQILSYSKYEKLAFKKIFNAYGDNIYYSDPDRANVYLGGGASPRNEQSLAYLLRNDVLTNIENLQAELAYLLKDTTPQSEKEHPDDLYMYAKAAKLAMDKYMKLVPPTELEQAREQMTLKRAGSGGDIVLN